MQSSAINFIQRNRRPIIGTLVGVVIAAIFVFEPRIAHASLLDDAIQGIYRMLANLMYWAIAELAKLLVVVINIMTSVAQYNKFLRVDAVERGWAIVRDVCNMFFIVVLLIIAFGTILRLENYRYNKLLARLIVMAILVNFSKFIAGFFIDFSQVVMLTFVNSWRDIAGGNITYALGLQDIVNLATSTELGDVTNMGPLLGALALGLVLIIIAVVVMVIIAIVLLLRILALWFLVVLSPLAFLLRTYPSSEKYAARWWQEFGKYTVTGPVVGFLLWLTLAIISQPTDFSADVFISRPDEVTTSDTTSPADDTASRITASITTIGSSGALLRYMMGIMLLVGTLVITKELGVAGGQLAGQAASRIQGFATKAATLAGGAAVFGVPATAAYVARKPILAGSKMVAKGIGGGLRNRIEAGFGVNINPKEWMEGIKEAGQERRRRAIEHRDRKVSDRLIGHEKQVDARDKSKKWYRRSPLTGFRGKKTGEKETKFVAPKPWLGALGDWKYGHEHVTPNLIRPDRWGRITGRDMAMSDTELRKRRKDRQDLEKAIESRKVSKKNPGDFWVEREAKRRSDERMKLEAERVSKERKATTDPKSPLYKELNYEVTGYGKDGKTPIYGSKTFKQLLDDAKKAAANTGEAFDPKAFASTWDRSKAEERLRRQARAGLVSERMAEIRKHLDENGSQSSYYKKPVMEDKTGEPTKKMVSLDERIKPMIDEAEKAAKAKGAAGLSDAERKALSDTETDDWAREFAEMELAADPRLGNAEQAVMEEERAKVLKETPDTDTRNRFGRQAILAEADRMNAEASNARTGNFTPEQAKLLAKEIDTLGKDITKLGDDIRSNGATQNADGSWNTHGLANETMINELVRKMDEKSGKKKQLEQYQKDGSVNEKEDKDSSMRKRKEGDQQEAKREAKIFEEKEKLLRDQAAAPATDSELALLEDKLMKARKAESDAETKVTAVRPVIPYELQRHLRDEVNAQKKKLLTDSWQEHAAVMEDALNRGDGALAAAALTRATEYGNENEIMMHFGYDFTPGEFKKMIKELFIGKAHMSQQQALSVATDVSYIAEKNRHWNVARTTRTDASSGRLEWQPYDEQQTEVLAEIRKLDFEDFTRRGNRLAWGSEFIGGDAMKNASREEKQAFFRAGGGRDFKMADYGQAYLAENFGKMMRNMKQSRFNVNLAVKMMSPSNASILDGLQDRYGNVVQRSEDKNVTFRDWRKLMGDFAARDMERGEFDILQDILRHVS